ncbi:hypothetical protein V8G54_007213, partial [Vigna mungo]
LHSTFRIKNQGDLTYFLGLEVARNSNGIHLSQRKYVLDLLHDIDMLDIVPVHTLIVPKPSPSPTNQHLDDNAYASYHRLIGKLIYLTITCPNITFVTGHQILSYLKACPGSGIFFNSTLSIQLKTLSDFDWATCLVTCKSIVVFSIFLGDSLIS